MPTSKKYDVYAIGNAIVDIITEVDHHFFTKNEVEKGVMTLVDEKRQQHLMQAIDMKKSKLSGGGSAGNTVTALAQLGGKSFFSCVVAQDELGKFFMEDLQRNGIDSALRYETNLAGHTGRCLVMTSPDAERTMNTFLGVSTFLSPEHLSEEDIKNSAYVYMEGYLVTSPTGFDTMKALKKLAEKNKTPTALTFSDPSMVKYFSAQMKEIVDTGVDLLFCNEEEAMIFTNTSSPSEASEHLKKIAKRFAMTQGKNGALIYDGDQFISVKPHAVSAVDTNGAGDMFAGAFMYAITHGHSYTEAGDLASLASSKVVAQWGPRLHHDEINKVKSGFLI